MFSCCAGYVDLRMLEDVSGTGLRRVRSLVDGDEDELADIVNHLRVHCADVFKKPIEKRFVAEMLRLRGQQQATMEIAKEVAAKEVAALAAHFGSPSPRDELPAHRYPRLRAKSRSPRGARARSSERGGAR